MKFIEQYKGKDLNKVPKSKLLNYGWNSFIKYDGNYVQIHKAGDEVIMYTSGGLPFQVKEIVQELETLPYDFIIEAEFNGKGSLGLKLGDRNLSATGTHTSKYSKNQESSDPECCIHIFDLISFENQDLRDSSFIYRRNVMLKNLLRDRFKHCIMAVCYDTDVSLDTAIKTSYDVIARGGEGLFLFHNTHTIGTTGRSNLAIKVKDIKIATGVIEQCVPSDTVSGEWGSLICTVVYDGKKYTQPFGGLKQEQRTATSDKLVGFNVKVKFESISSDGKLIQGSIV